MRYRRMMAVVMGFCVAGGVCAQSLPSTGPSTTSRPATPPEGGTTNPATTATRPKGNDSPAAIIERKLDGIITELTLSGVRLDEAVSAYQQVVKVNVAVNWHALEKIGVTKETPVWLHVRMMDAEGVLRLLLEGMGTEKGRLQYAVSEEGGGLIEVSTMEGFGKQQIVHLYEARKLSEVVLQGASVDEKGLPRTKIELVMEMIGADLAGLGEPEQSRKLRFDEKAGKIVLNGSQRAEALAERSLITLASAVGWRQVTPKGALLPLQKKTQDALAAKVNMATREHTLTEFADYLADVGKVKIVVMPGAVDGSMRKSVEMTQGSVEALLSATAGAFGVSWEIYQNGTVVIARKEQTAWHAILGAYDVREVIKQMSKNGGVTKAAGAIIDYVKTNIEDVGFVAVIDGVLVFRVKAEGHRKFAREFDVWVKKPK